MVERNMLAYSTFETLAPERSRAWRPELSVSFDPRSLGSLTPGFAFHDTIRAAVLHGALMERFHVFTVMSGEVEGSTFAGKAVDLVARTGRGIILVEAKGADADIIEALRGSLPREGPKTIHEPERRLSPEAKAL